MKRPLKILYVAHERKLGGATISLLALISEMRRRGCEITVIVPTPWCPIAKKLKEMKIRVIPIFYAWWQMPADWNIFFKVCFRLLYSFEKIQTFYIYRLLKKDGIDIVHSNSSVIDFGARIAYRLQCKHVWHFREYGDADYNLEYMFDERKIFAAVNKLTDKVIFISKDLYNYYKDKVDEEISQVIYNGISQEYIYLRDYTRANKKTVFLIAGNLHRNKQQMLVLDAVHRLKNKKITNFELWIAGSSSSMADSREYENELNEYIIKNKLQNVTMLGHVSDMKGLRKKADIEIVSSSREAFGRVTVEAMFCGMPVIGSNSGANPEIIKSGFNGLLFEKGNAEQLSQRMLFFLDHLNEIERMGNNAFNFSQERFLATKNASEIFDLYVSLMGNY